MFGAEPVIRKAARRRALFAAVAMGCAAAVIATAVALPYTLRPAPSPVVSMSVSPSAGSGPWPALFGCGRPLPSVLPGSSGFGLKVSVLSVRRTAPGAPEVTWTVAVQPGGTAPALGPLSSIVLVVRDDGMVIAALRAPPAAGAIQMTLPQMVVSGNDVQRGRPHMRACQPNDWAPVWGEAARYRVVVVLSAWGEFPDLRPGMLPARYSATASLPPSVPASLSASLSPG